MMTTNTAPALPGAQFCTSTPQPTPVPRKATRRGRSHHAAACGPMPEVEQVPAAVRVELFGSTAAGRTMLLDEADWQHASATWGHRWGLYQSNYKFFYVGSARREARRDMLTTSKRARPFALLARLMLGAAPGQDIVFLNGDSLDLRRSNLSLLSEDDTRRRRLDILAGGRMKRAAKGHH